jgi:hypothetical protein
VRRLEQGAVARQCEVDVTATYLLRAWFGRWWSRWLVCRDFADDYADASDADYEGVGWGCSSQLTKQGSRKKG